MSISFNFFIVFITLSIYFFLFPSPKNEYRWPSWAPREEYQHFDNIRKLSQWIPQTGFPSIFRLLNGRVHVPIIEKAAVNQEKKWPLVVFSHGLGCARFTYSQVCYDLASYGYIVIAPEHR